MPTLISLLLTAGQLLIVLVGFFKPELPLFDALVTYGSPPSVMMYILNGHFSMLFANFFFVMLLLFHLVKYVLLAISQMQDSSHGLHYTAMAFEGIYLVISVMYIVFPNSVPV